MTAREASGVYGFLCAGTHPALFQARQLRTYVDHGDHLGTVLTIDVPQLERLLAVPVTTYYNGLSYTIDFYGLDRTAHDQLTNKLEEVLPGILTA